MRQVTRNGRRNRQRIRVGRAPTRARINWLATAARAALALVALAPSLAAAQGWRDITAEVIAATSVDEQIARACAEFCHGNQRVGSLQRILVAPAGGGAYRVEGEALFQHRQNSGFIVVFDEAVRVRAEGVIDKSTCRLRVERVQLLSADFQRFFADAPTHGGDLTGKVYQISNCARFLN